MLLGVLGPRFSVVLLGRSEGELGIAKVVLGAADVDASRGAGVLPVTLADGSGELVDE